MTNNLADKNAVGIDSPLIPFDLEAAASSAASKMGRCILSDDDLLVLSAMSIRGSSTFMERGYK